MRILTRVASFILVRFSLLLFMIFKFFSFKFKSFIVYIRKSLIFHPLISPPLKGSSTQFIVCLQYNIFYKFIDMNSEQNHNLNFDFDIDLTSFTKSIKENFLRVWEAVEKNRQGVDECKEKILHSGRTRSPKKGEIKRNQSKEISLDFSDNSAVVVKQFEEEADKQEQIDNHEMKMTQSKIITPEEFKTETKEERLKSPMNPPPTLPKKEKIINNESQVSQQFTQKSEDKEKKQSNAQSIPYNESQNPFEQIELKERLADLSYLENKVLELNQRMESMEMNSARQVGLTSKKFNQVHNEIEKNNVEVEKKINKMKQLEKEVDGLRNELSEYKLKKQSKLMKMSNKLENSQNSSEMNNYIVQKLQFLSKYVTELVTKQEFVEEVESLDKRIEQIKRKFNDTVGLQQFNDIIKILEKKFSTKMNKKSTQSGMESQNKIEAAEDEIMGNEIKILEHEKKLKQLQESFEEQLSDIKEQNKKSEEKMSDLAKKHENLMIADEKEGLRMGDHEKFMKDMNTNYNKKFRQVEDQLIETQECIQKINNQIKFYNFTSTKSETNATLGNAASTNAFDISKSVELQNQITALKKKFNKISLKVQTSKEEVLAFRQDFAREVDGVRIVLEKKCDWESLRKGMNYFEDRIKEVSHSITEVLQEMEVNKNEQTTAAKRGWTCLCCDKDIKNYEGKLGEAKFLSVFPARYESPRIGGYYRQRQSQKDYKSIYTKHRRMSNGQISKTKEEIG